MSWRRRVKRAGGSYGGSGRIPGGSVGLPYIGSKGDIREGLLSILRTLSSASGRSCIQSMWSSRESLVSMFFRVRLVLSTFPED